MLAPILVIARSTLADAPSPIATTQITAPTPMMMPSIVNPVRSLFCASAFSAIRGIMNRFIGTLLSCQVGSLADARDSTSAAGRGRSTDDLTT